MSPRDAALVEVGRFLQAQGYRFVTVTPRTHTLVAERAGPALARDLRDVFGWNRPFEPRLFHENLWRLMVETGLCHQLSNGTWQSAFRCSSLDDELYFHSSFPTSGAAAVFFGPDTYRFVRAVLPLLPASGRLVDIGCGSGVGGIAAAKRSQGGLSVTLADINPAALALARVNATLANRPAEVVHSDVLGGIDTDLDVVISNPPYLVDSAHRTYRDGGGHFGAELGARIVAEALPRLASSRHGGKLLMYTGAAIVDGRDCFLQLIEPVLRRFAATYSYEEVDPDVFPEELLTPAYAPVDRIAAVLLQAAV